MAGLLIKVMAHDFRVRKKGSGVLKWFRRSNDSVCLLCSAFSRCASWEEHIGLYQLPFTAALADLMDSRHLGQEVNKTSCG